MSFPAHFGRKLLFIGSLIASLLPIGSVRGVRGSAFQRSIRQQMQDSLKANVGGLCRFAFIVRNSLAVTQFNFLSR